MSLFASIPFGSDLSDRWCCFCERDVKDEDILWRANEHSSYYVCRECFKRSKGHLLDQVLRDTQKPLLN